MPMRNVAITYKANSAGSPSSVTKEDSNKRRKSWYVLLSSRIWCCLSKLRGLISPRGTLAGAFHPGSVDISTPGYTAHLEAGIQTQSCVTLCKPLTSLGPCSNTCLTGLLWGKHQLQVHGRFLCPHTHTHTHTCEDMCTHLCFWKSLTPLHLCSPQGDFRKVNQERKERNIFSSANQKKQLNVKY